MRGCSRVHGDIFWDLLEVFFLPSACTMIRVDGTLLCMRSIPLFLSIPFLVRQVVESGSSVGLYGFIGASVAAVTIMGGTYAIMPAYEVRACSCSCSCCLSDIARSQLIVETLLSPNPRRLTCSAPSTWARTTAACYWRPRVHLSLDLPS